MVVVIRGPKTVGEKQTMYIVSFVYFVWILIGGCFGTPYNNDSNSTSRCLTAFFKSSSN